jgi:ankyrin repeat protein
VNDLAIDLLLEESKSSAISKGFLSTDPHTFYPSFSREICSPLHVFAYFGLDNIAGDYIQRFGNDAIDSKVARADTTPLHIAVRYKHANFVQLLLRNGANVEARDGAGQTPLLALLYTVAY